MDKPNLLLIMTDQQRWDAMGCSGGWVETPNMDRIAGEGIRFSNCVTNSPVCIPARLSLATGLYPHNTGVWQNMGHTLSPDAKTWMQVVREAGYRTSLFGKTHLHPHGGDLRDREHLMHAYGLDDVNEIGGPRASARCLSYMTKMWQQKGKWEAYQEDFDERFANKPYVVRPSVLDLEDYADVYVGQQAKTYLQNYDRDQPWFCWVSFGGPHEPWDTPEPYASRYRPEDMPAPVLAPDDDRERPRGLLDKRLENGQIAFEPGEEKKLRANYAGNITLIDDQIGEILGVLEARGELDNTVIVLVSDHGEMNGDYGFIYKEHFLNGAVRVPLLVRTPQTVQSDVAGTVCDSPVEWMDVGPTLVELAGGELSHQQFGKSLCPTLADVSTEHRVEAISEYGGEVMLLNREWKAVLNREGQVYLLFNVEDDPQEVNNLAGLPEFSDVERGLRLRVLERLICAQVTSGIDVQAKK
jgi:choline-sulfatase